jgi:hypothetical protein
VVYFATMSAKYSMLTSTQSASRALFGYATGRRSIRLNSNGP